MVQIPKKYGLKPEDAPLCKCGCGKQVAWNRRTKAWSDFIKSHHLRVPTEATRQKMRVKSLERWGTLEERFNQRLGKVSADGCVAWKGTIDSYGYGVLKSQKKTIKAHRYAWERVNGVIPEGSLVCHRCDNTACVNPDHLFLGNHADNHADRNAKGRQAKGEKQGSAKLTTDEVRAIRALSERGFSTSWLADMFGVTSGAVYHIVTGRTWKHI